MLRLAIFIPCWIYQRRHSKPTQPAPRRRNGRRNLLVIHANSEDKAYAEANHVIVEEALSLGRQLRRPVIAALVWDGKSRGEGDPPQEFGVYAQQKGVPVVDVLTLDPQP
jgi:hypothetical protein